MVALLGIDLGGTWIKIAQISATGGLFVRFLTPDGTEANNELIKQLSNLRSAAGSVTHIGMARAPGLDSNGCVCDWPSQPSWLGVPLLKIIKDVVGHVPLHYDDGICAAVWEHLTGSWLNRSTTACLSIGTGLGVGIVKQGQVLATGDGCLSLGHLPFGNPDLFCKCGKRGCLQTVLSSKAFQRVFTAGSENTVAQLESSFSHALCFLSQTFGVENVVLTGGVLEGGKERLLLEEVARRVDKKNIKIFISPTPSLSALAGSLILSILGDDFCNEIDNYWFNLIHREIKNAHQQFQVDLFN